MRKDSKVYSLKARLVNKCKPQIIKVNNKKIRIGVLLHETMSNKQKQALQRLASEFNVTVEFVII